MTGGACIAVAWFVVASMGSVTVAAEQASTFAQKVAAYREYVTPRCAPEMVSAYMSYNRGRDSAFVRSLQGTPLRDAYFKAIRAKEKRDAGTVFHCNGPPPPPPIGTVVSRPDPRSVAIRAAQNRMEAQARDLPAYFDAADAAFRAMQAARDATTSGAE